jgi:8-oxo-dGTP diphosphatase
VPQDARFLEHPRPFVSVDLVVLTILDATLRVLLVRRKLDPFAGQWALPGGFVRVGRTPNSQGEDLDQAAARELNEETSLTSEQVYLEQLHTFGNAGRDPRGRVITVAYYALVRPDLAPQVKAGGDAAEAQWFEVSQIALLNLAFDHHEIVETTLGRIREKLDSTDIAFDLVPATFTIPELRHVFGIVLGKPIDPGNFRRSFNRWVEDGRIEKAPGKRITTSKPAAVYRFRR